MCQNPCFCSVINKNMLQFLEEIHLPLCTVANTKGQSNDIPEELF